MSHAEEIEKVRKFLEGESTLVLSVRDTEGAVHSAALFYFLDAGPKFYWISSEKSRHSECLVANAQVAATVYHSTFKWQEISGVQMEGVAGVLEGTLEVGELKRILDGYRKRFDLSPLLAPIIAASTLYYFEPKWLRYTDNHNIFSRKFELEF